MERSEIVDGMKHHLAEYVKLKDELAKLEGPQRRADFVEKMKKYVEAFKGKYTVEATREANPIDWEKIESELFSDKNLDEHLNPNPTGFWTLGFSPDDGMAGYGLNYGHGGVFTPFAYDKVDAERYIERQVRKIKLKERGPR